MSTSEPGRTLLLVRRLGAAAALALLGAAVASALGSGTPAAAGPAVSGPVLSSPVVPAPAPAVSAAPARAAPRAAPEPCNRGSPEGVVNLNQASAAQLELLPGVGPALAARIVDHRQRHGRFTRVRDLRRVKGFGPRTLARLAPLLVLDGPTTLAAKRR